MKPACTFICVMLTAAFAEAQIAPRGPQPEGQAIVPGPNQARPAPPGLAIQLSRNLQRGDVIARGNRASTVRRTVARTAAR